MKRIVVRYKVEPERVEENERLVRGVFDELEARKPDGIRYASLRLADRVSFVHVVSIETPDGSNPLTEIPAFAEFTRAIDERCDEPPVAADAEVVGSYRVFAE